MSNELEKKFGLISIVMAAYNSEKTIERAIDSVLHQTYKNWDLWIIDDCSTDNTLRMIKKYTDTRIHIVCNDRNMGVAYSRHQGFVQSSGNWIAILDSDDIWHPEKIEQQVLYQLNNGGKLLFTGSSFITNEGKKINWILHVPKKVGYKQLLKQNIISNSSVLVDRNLLLKNEVLDDSIHEDFACWLKILKKGYLAYGIDKPLLIYRISSHSKSGNKINSAKMNWRTYRKLGLSSLYALYNMLWYTCNGFKKYRNFK